MMLDDRGHGTPCWIWTGSADADGYGRVRINNSADRPYRVMYKALIGPIPDGLTIDHLCRVRACCNPWHLEPVSLAENISRNRSIRYEGRRGPRGTLCAKGHPFTAENTVHVRVRGIVVHRRCRTCRNEYAAQWARNRAAVAA